MRKLMMVAAALAVGAMVASPAQAQVKFGTVLNWGDDADFGLGAKLNFGVGNITDRANIEGQVAFDYYFPDGFDYWTITGSGIYSLTPSGSIAPHVGAGLGLARASFDVGTFGGSDTSLFLNLLGGLRFKAIGNVTPFTEARLQIGDGSQFVLSGGVFFGRN